MDSQMLQILDLYNLCELNSRITFTSYETVTSASLEVLYNTYNDLWSEQQVHHAKKLYHFNEQKLTWCARATKLSLLRFKKDETMSPPKVHETPLSFSPQPVIS